MPTFTGSLKKEKDCIQAIIDQAWRNEEQYIYRTEIYYIQEA